MDFYDVIEDRKSIRKFKNTEICKEKMARIINAAMRSPSWKNETSYKFIIVQDGTKRTELASTIINKSDEASEAIRVAPVTAVVVADPDKSGTIENKQYYLVDSAIAMEHFILAATAEGYGTCWIGAFDEDKVKGVLDIPQNYKVVGMTPVGESNENKESHPKKDVREYVFLDKWHNSYTENI
ncbi:nitroreductase family protein [Clostridium sporogenes]|uniref:nitroreductase family protein n=1 Tax=Clostridium sporogenes TaxID=1509 RepID=UPI003F92F5AE